MVSSITLEEIVRFLLAAPMFGDLDAGELSEIVHIMQIQRLRPKQAVFREGDRGDAWYVVYDGRVEVLKDSGFDNSVIAVLGEGACFGEMAILDGSTRSATVRATENATLFGFPRDEFDELLEEGNLAAYKLVHQMARVLAKRQRETTASLAEMMDTTPAPPFGDEVGSIVRESSVSE